jgi:Ca2+-binding EF-hand superfamily protein
MEQFRIVDENGDGILSEDQFIDLTKNLSYQIAYPLDEQAEKALNDQIDGYLDQVDPFNTNQIPLSDVV